MHRRGKELGRAGARDVEAVPITSALGLSRVGRGLFQFVSCVGQSALASHAGTGKEVARLVLSGWHAGRSQLEEEFSCVGDPFETVVFELLLAAFVGNGVNFRVTRRWRGIELAVLILSRQWSLRALDFVLDERIKRARPRGMRSVSERGKADMRDRSCLRRTKTSGEEAKWARERIYTPQ